MTDIDHMLNGAGSRRKHQQMIDRAARRTLIKEQKQNTLRNHSRLHTILLSIINLLGL